MGNDEEFITSTNERLDQIMRDADEGGAEPETADEVLDDQALVVGDSAPLVVEPELEPEPEPEIETIDVADTSEQTAASTRSSEIG